MYKMFPRLKERQHTEAGVLSGGEQQMLTLCRTLMGDPDLIIIDEPTEGLAPKIVELVAEYLQELRKRGISVLLIEQKLTIAMKISDRCLVMGHGSIVFEGTPDEPAQQHRHPQGMAGGVGVNLHGRPLRVAPCPEGAAFDLGRPSGETAFVPTVTCRVYRCQFLLQKTNDRSFLVIPLHSKDCKHDCPIPSSWRRRRHHARTTRQSTAWASPPVRASRMAGQGQC
jgi:hypothetical protein